MSGPRRVVLFEDEAVCGLGPVVDLRPAFEIRVGALNLRERLELSEGIEIAGADCRELVGRGGILPRATDSGDAVRVNARLCAPVDSLRGAILDLEDGEALVRDGVTVARRGAGTRLREAPPELVLVDRPWDFLVLNDRMLVADAATLAQGRPFARRIHSVRFEDGSGRTRLLESETYRELTDPPGAIVIGPGPVLAAPGVEVRPGAVLDGAAGPVILGSGVVVHPLSVVTGPAYLGPGTVVNPGAKLRAGTSVGAFCKLGGEVEESIILDLSNKQHDGFLGHALVGSWVNLGADTNGSDLKNNYSFVKVDLGSGPVDSGSRFVGPHLADHAKTGIDTMLNTGAVVSVAANVFGGGFVPGYVPPFSWGGADGLVEYRLDAALDTARTAFARRDAMWTAEVEGVLREHFADTQAFRERYGVR